MYSELPTARGEEMDALRDETVTSSNVRLRNGRHNEALFVTVGEMLSEMEGRRERRTHT
jgi:hypothetical protein